MNIRVDKVKFDGSKVRIEYANKRPDNQYDEFTLGSVDRPAQPFFNAMDALRQDVIAICELADADADKLTVRGVTFTHTNDVFGACITALKKLTTANAPLVLNTPHLTEEAYGEGDTSTPLLKRETIDRLLELSLAAERYIDGERAQGTLFDAGLATEAPAEGTT